MSDDITTADGKNQGIASTCTHVRTGALSVSPDIEKLAENHIILHPPQHDSQKERIYQDAHETISVILREIKVLETFAERLRGDLDKLARG